MLYHCVSPARMGMIHARLGFNPCHGDMDRFIPRNVLMLTDSVATLAIASDRFGKNPFIVSHCSGVSL